MSYTALYRKFRPLDFADVKGQDHIVTTLQNQIKANRIGHAYLFCGTRGTGKTTAAKIFARAVNCSDPVDGSPCGKCAMCQSILNGSSMNVIEIDAASNNGVDNIREIRDEVAYRPTEGRYKVYIIDEVHMLSTGAFNALLKTLEEPPEYVIFILATTEVHKIPITILSRCQRYDFRRIGIDVITDRLRDLMEIEQIDVEERALRFVARAGDGSLRDALSLLDQCIAFHLGETLTYDHVIEVLGAVDTDTFSKILKGIESRDVGQILRIVEELVTQGRELYQLTVDFTWYLRNLLLIQTSEDARDVVDASAENLEQMKQDARLLSTDALLRDIRIFSELSNQMHFATQKRVLLEVALMKLCTPAMEVNTDSLLDRIRVLEEKIESGAFVQAPSNYARTDGFPAYHDDEAEKSPVVVPTAVPDDVKQVVKNFRAIASEMSAPTNIYLKKARLSQGEGNVLLLVFSDATAYGGASTPEHVRELEQIIENKIGRKVEVETRLMEEGRRFEDTYADLESICRQNIMMEIEMED